MSASRAKGTRWEVELVEFFNAHGHPLVERRALRGTKDAGDLIMPGYVMEAKNCREWRLNEWMTDAVPDGTTTIVPSWAIARRDGCARSGRRIVAADAQGVLDFAAVGERPTHNTGTGNP